MTGGRLLLIRHGQTGGNKHRYVGWEDVPLDETGRDQAIAVADILKDQTLQAVYSSPLSRAVETARPLAARQALEIRIRHELKEIDYGQYQGLLKADQPLKLRHDHRFAPMPGGESLYDVFVRIQRFAEEARSGLSSGLAMAVVGHFWSNRMLVGALSGFGFEELFTATRYKPANGSIYELCFRTDGELRLDQARWLEPGSRMAEE